MDKCNEKMNVENTDTIDSLAYEKDSFTLILLLSDGMDWTDKNRHLLLLREKLNSYIRYIDTKQYTEKYSDVRKIEVRVSFLFKESDECCYLLKRAGLVLKNIFENTELKIEHGTNDS